MHRKMILLCTICAMLSLIFHVSPQAQAEYMFDMYRLYNPNSGEHFYTSDEQEMNVLVSRGWKYEGVGWKAPSSSETPVYRLYNKTGGEHHYTTDKKERDALIKKYGWTDEGIGWYSDDSKRVKVYREYNPNAFANNHNYTPDTKEHKALINKYGWKDEGIAWYGSGKGDTEKSTPLTGLSIVIGDQRLPVHKGPSRTSGTVQGVSGGAGSIWSVLGIVAGQYETWYKVGHNMWISPGEGSVTPYLNRDVNWTTMAFEKNEYFMSPGQTLTIRMKVNHGFGTGDFGVMSFDESAVRAEVAGFQGDMTSDPEAYALVKVRALKSGTVCLLYWLGMSNIAGTTIIVK